MKLKLNIDIEEFTKLLISEGYAETELTRAKVIKILKERLNTAIQYMYI